MNIRRYRICLLAVLVPVLATVSVGCTNNSIKVQAKKTEREVSLWNCHGNSLGKWECSELTTRAPLPPQQAPALPPQTETTTTTIQAEVVTVASVREENTKHPLLKFPSHYYAVQLLAAKNESTIAWYKNRYPAISAETISVNYNGNHFQLLILGVYPSVSEARHAIAQLSTTPGTTPWIRPMAPLQTFLQAS